MSQIDLLILLSTRCNRNHSEFLHVHGSWVAGTLCDWHEFYWRAMWMNLNNTNAYQNVYCLRGRSFCLTDSIFEVKKFRNLVLHFAHKIICVDTPINLNVIRKDKWIKFNVRELLFLAKAKTESRSNYVENCYN